WLLICIILLFLFTSAPTSLIYTLSLHDALPISLIGGDASGVSINGNTLDVDPSVYAALADGESEIITYTYDIVDGNGGTVSQTRSEEHTSELQSRENLVCRLLLEKKKITINT